MTGNCFAEILARILARLPAGHAAGDVRYIDPVIGARRFTDHGDVFGHLLPPRLRITDSREKRRERLRALPLAFLRIDRPTEDAAGSRRDEIALAREAFAALVIPKRKGGVEGKRVAGGEEFGG